MNVLMKKAKRLINVLNSLFYHTEPQIRQIVDNLENPALQTLFFTATWPREVQQMADTFLKSPVQLKIGKLLHMSACFLFTVY